MNYTNEKIGKLVANDFRLATVFRKYGIDFCCGGGRTLTDVCIEKDLELQTVVANLDHAVAVNSNREENYNSYSLTHLVNHILDQHHKYVREAIPPLLDFTSKVARVHGERIPEVISIAKHFMSLSEELIDHMAKEEAILFPYIIDLDVKAAAGLQADLSIFGSISNPISALEKEHELAGDDMKMINNLSNNFNSPIGACMTHRVSYLKLQEFEENLHKHIHLENNILFPSALRLEKTLTTISQN